MRPIARLVSVLVLVLVALLIPGLTVFAKGDPNKITLTGPGLAHPIEITDRMFLSLSDPWTRPFVDWGRGLVAEPPLVEQTHTAFFYLEVAERNYCPRREGTSCVIYVLHYYPDPAGGPGYLYFPGGGEPWHELNMGTIISGDSDRWDPNGKWHHATAEWDEAIQLALREHGGGTLMSDSPVLAAETANQAGQEEGGSPPVFASVAAEAEASSDSASAGTLGVRVLWVVALLAVGLLSGASGWLGLRRLRNPA
ncbi:MAG: hypothetical protein CL878_02475 [Dehalococcoidia bacterium]|nr:hypothetical protein [Dehalococcoidia bacterium]